LTYKYTYYLTLDIAPSHYPIAKIAWYIPVLGCLRS